MATSCRTIAHVLHSFATGGMEKVVAAVIRMGSTNFRHVLVCLTVAGSSTRYLPPNVEIIELHKPPGNSLTFIWSLSRCLKKLQPDIVQSYNWSGMDAIIAARLAGLKNVVQSEHGWDMEDPDGRDPKRLRIRRLLSRWTSAFTCVSRNMKIWLRDEVRVYSPVVQIYNGVDTQQYRPGPGKKIRREFGISDAAFVLGIVSRLDPIKDHALLLRAFSRLLESHPESALLVVGDGPEEERLRRLAGSNVFFLGNRMDVPKILQAMDVFVLSSLNEGISCAIIEAMSSALPVVATDVGGNPELIDHGITGFLFPARNEDKLLSLFKIYASNRQLAVVHGAAARKKIMLSFSNEKMVRSYERLYDAIISKSI